MAAKLVQQTYTRKLAEDLIVATLDGLFCPAGEFYIDPWRPVRRAVITHAHADHLHAGNAEYVTSAAGAALVAQRLPADAEVRLVPYGEPLACGATRISLHPAGHVLGSAQVRIEHQGSVWVVSGDYKRDPDPSCEPFEPVPCNVFISEATFALPAYRWPPAAAVVGEIFEWWQANRARGAASVLFAYALGKAQRVLAELTRFTAEAVYVHGAVAAVTEIYRKQGVVMLPTLPVADLPAVHYSGALIIAPPSAAGSTWMRRFGDSSTGFCSGWMRVRGNRRRRGIDRGFVLSDHADWPSLLRTFRDCGARRILLTHGHSDSMTRYLREQGIAAAALQTEYGAED
jgi:putative mRNA 3-end processing factor